MDDTIGDVKEQMSDQQEKEKKSSGKSYNNIGRTNERIFANTHHFLKYSAQAPQC